MTTADRVMWAVLARIPSTAPYWQRLQVLETLRRCEARLIAVWPGDEPLPPFPDSMWTTYDPQRLIDWLNYAECLRRTAFAYLSTQDASCAMAVLTEHLDVGS